MRLIYLKECRRYTVASLQACISLQLGTPQPDSTSKIEDESIKRLKESINGEFIRRLKDSINKECGKTIVRGKGDVIVFHYVGLYDYIDAETNLTFFFVPKFLDVRDSDETDDAEKDEVGNNWAADDFTSWKTCYEKFEKHGRDVLLRALDRYSKEDSKIADEYEDSDQRRERILELAVRMLRDYLENGLYVVQLRELELNGQGEIDWNTTIDTFQPIIKDGRPYYMEVLTEQAYSDEDHYITRLHKCLVTTWGRKLEELGLSSILRVNVPMLSEEDPDHFGDNDYKIAQINRELKVQFVTRKRETLVLMRNLIERMSEKHSVNDESLSFGMTGVEQLWEKACAAVLGSELDKNIRCCKMDWDADVTFRDYMPKPIWQNLSDDQTATDDERLGSAKSGWRLDFIRTWPKEGHVDKLVILDAKYYCVRWDKDSGKISGQPGVGDIAKQIFYQMSFKDLRAKNSGVTILNAFLFPDVEENQDQKIKLGEVVELKFSASAPVGAFEGIKICSFRLPGIKLLETYADYKINDDWFKTIVDRMTAKDSYDLDASNE